jgi:2-oxoglutarate ferredoxin oxidoreductase subunit alpha
MQARWGSHGDYEIIALAPQSPQEAYTLTITAFNLAERYRCPVMLMLDECVGHMTEKVTIPTADTIEIIERRLTDAKPGEYLPYATNGDEIPAMAHAGSGHRYHITGLTHDERGYPDMSAAAQDKLVRRLCDKIRDHADEIVLLEEDGMDDADVVVLSYGITSRVARAAIDGARRQNIKVGGLRLITLWPFCETRIRELAPRVKAFVVPEINYGQVTLEVERCAAGQAGVVGVYHMGGGVHDPAEIQSAIVEAAT